MITLQEARRCSKAVMSYVQYTTGFPLVLAAIFVLLTSVTKHAVSQEPVEVQTDLGMVRGSRQTVLNAAIDVFLGIPYAEPPLGDKRFRHPVQKQPWSSPVDATKLPNTCSQAEDESYDKFEGVKMWNPNTEVSEDCLYLNIWSPAAVPNRSRNLTVLVWVYGGSFAGGTSTLPLYDGRILAAKGQVVVVSIQYRVGPLGLLYLDIPDAPGNAGLMDQRLAFKWVYDHIHSFGGDRSRITVFGESSGAASIALHLMSEGSKPYINNAILQSASSLAPWAVDSPEVAVQRAKDLATQVGCPPADNPQATVECLRGKPADELYNKQWNIDDNSVISSPFVPTVDENFLRDVPDNLVNSSKKVNVLLGATANEGTYFLLYRHANVVKLVNGQFGYDKYLQVTKSIVSHLDEHRSSLVQLVAHEYENHTKPVPDLQQHLRSLDHMLGDVAFACPVVEFADAYQAMEQQVYMYLFNHRTSANPWPSWTGVMHGYEIDHVFGAPLNLSNAEYTSEERTFSEVVIRYWTNFAKSGDPNRGENGFMDVDVAWPVYDQGKRYLVLDVGEFTEEREAFKLGECRFWNKVFPVLSTDPSICGADACIATVLTTLTSLLTHFLLTHYL